jgi:aspartate/methionine/tyrosine aminotransferase
VSVEGAGAALPPFSPALAAAPKSGIREILNVAIGMPDAIRLEVGEPDFETPSHIREAAKAAIDEGYTRYTHTQGMLSLREALAEKLLRVNGIRATPDQIVCGPGGVGALAAVFAALVADGDEVLTPDPGWPNTSTMIRWARGREVRYPCPPSLGFEPDLDRLETLVTDRTRVLLVNSPNNPTGAVYAERTLDRIAEVAQRHDLWLVSDECYDQIMLDGREVVSSVATRVDDGRVICAFSCSKTYAMTGWRVGYAVGDVRIMREASKFIESSSACVSGISQKAAEAAVTGPQTRAGEMVRAYRERRELAVRILSEAGLLMVVPQGAFYVMADISRSGVPAREFALRLLSERGVAVAPGSAFGEVARSAVRISLASSDEALAEGLRRLCEFVAASEADRR